MASRKRYTGRVLRLKTGYNPNSSSVGSDIPTFLAAACAAAARGTIVLNALSAAAQSNRRRKSGAAPAGREVDET